MENQNEIFISIQDHTGDSKLTLKWDKDDSKAIEFAQNEFNRLIDNGYKIFKVKRVLGVFSKKGEEIKNYDPSLGKVYYEEGETQEKDFTLTEVEVLPGDSAKVLVERADKTKEPTTVDVAPKESALITIKEKKEKTKSKPVELIKYEEPKKFNPMKEKVSKAYSYVVTRPLRAG